MLPKPLSPWKSSWEGDKIVELNGNQLITAHNMLCQEVVNRYVFSFPVFLLGGMEYELSKENRANLSDQIYLFFNSKGSSMDQDNLWNLSKQFRWLENSYIYELKFTKLILTYFSPVFLSILTNFGPLSKNSYEEILQEASSCVLCDNNDELVENLDHVFHIDGIIAEKNIGTLIIHYSNGGIFKFLDIRSSIYDEILISNNSINFIRENSIEFSKNFCIRPAISPSSLLSTQYERN